jgi:hypothetical protein
MGSDVTEAQIDDLSDDGQREVAVLRADRFPI